MLFFKFVKSEGLLICHNLVSALTVFKMNPDTWVVTSQYFFAIFTLEQSITDSKAIVTVKNCKFCKDNNFKMLSKRIVILRKIQKAVHI